MAEDPASFDTSGEDAKTATIDRREMDRSFAKGVAWSALSRLSAQALTWIVTIAVAHILTKSDYGLVASVMIVIGMLRMVTEFGLGSAIVAHGKLTDSQVAQLGGFALILGLAAFVLTCGMALVAGSLIQSSHARSILPVLGLSAALATLNSLPTALLQRRLEFRALSNLEAIRAILASVLVLGLALAGFGFWSLVLNDLVASVVFTALLYWRTRYTLAMPTIEGIRPAFRLSSEVVISRVAFYFYANADLAAVSLRGGTVAAGEYSMAWTLTSLPNEKINSILLSVAPGVFARVRDNDAELSRYFLLLIEMFALFLFPATIGLALVAPEFVSVILGEKWTPIIPIIRVLSLFLAVRCLIPTATTLLISRLRSRAVMNFALGCLAVLPAGFYFAARWGGVAVAWVWVVLYPLIAYAIFKTTCDEINLPMRRLFGVLLKPLTSVVVMSAAVMLVRSAIGDWLPVVRLVVLSLVGALSFAGSVLFLMRERAVGLLKAARGLRAGKPLVADESLAVATDASH